MAAVESRIEAELAVGDHGGVIGELETLVREHPYRERLRALQMLALYRSGRQAEALRAYQRARTLLGEELGIEPSSELRDLEQRILEQDPGLDLVSDAPSHRQSARVDARGPRVGRTVRGYELRAQIGEGDFGFVYRAYQPSVGREVAIKVIRPEYVNRSDFLMRFEAEAQLVAQLEHPHIVGLLDYWRDPEGAYLVMPLLQGGSLAEALRSGPWNLSAALQLLEDVGAALGYAHRQGLIHRDIKPGNVLLDGEGNAYLADFGIALRLLDPAGTPITSSLAYLPPEEVRGETLTPRADIFSLGVLAFHLFTGVYPAGRRPLPSLAGARPGLPADLDRVLRRSTDDQPNNRYERVEDFIRALRRAVGTDMVAIAETDEPMAVVAGVRNPYKGLRSFAETDALDFHGREVLIDELLLATSANPVVALVGPSGSGKSSVVRAGLIPALRAGGLAGSKDWLVTDMFPGSYPFEELEAALLRVAVERPPGLIDELTSDERGLLRVTKQILPADESRLLLVIDQFEEVFSVVGAEETRRLFLDSLVTIAADERSRVHVVLTMRADFFDRPLDYAAFGGLVRSGLVTVSPPTEDGLAQAIAAPARSVGVDLEPGLVGEIVRDVEGQPGALPLLQYALTELFSHREGNLLTLDAYRSTGGVAGALGRRAEELFADLSDEGKEVARQVFLRLVTVDELSGDTRRRV
ncbi:MAG TPA: protein kinase, partial [Acidimicrobiia bacterium]|nr:protein kinase [Acidimicrobiia bacterium]